MLIDQSETVSSQEIFGLRPDRACVTWFHRNPDLGNQHCLYCGVYVGAGADVASDKEHLINRRIAAPGMMAKPNAFNFIFRACQACNAEKAALEDHISAVTLLTSPGRDDPAIDAAARRKAASSIDPVQRRPIGEVRHDFSFQAGSNIRFGMITGAQADPRKVRTLAFRQMQGLFSLVTSKNPLRADGTRLLPAKHFGFYDVYPYRDWGNPKLIEIARRSREYESVAEITSADGFFRAALRRACNSDSASWFWALEWNQNLRSIGWIGNQADPPPLFLDLPSLIWIQVDANTRIREETPLADEAEDLLFDPVPAETTGSAQTL